MDDPQCRKGGHQLCLLVICILAFIIPAHTHAAAAAGATWPVAEVILDMRTTIDELKASRKAEKKVINGIHHSLAVKTDKISALEETLQVLKDKVNQLEQKQTAVESRIALKAENAHFEAIFEGTQVNPGPIKFRPSYITTFGSKEGEQRELSANCGSSKWKEDASTGRCYYIPPDENSERMSWPNASTRCQMEGGQLVSIGSPEEQNFINGMMKDKVDAYWTGGRRIQGRLHSSDATGWEWTDGSPFNFTNWQPGQPNNYGGHQDCIKFWALKDGQWSDSTCSENYTPFCEKPGTIADGVFTAPISGIYEVGFTAWTPLTVNGSMVDIRNNNRKIASALSNSVGMFGTSVIEELKVGDKVTVFLSQGAIIGGQSERSAKFFGKLIHRS